MFWHTQELYQGVQADRSSQQGLPSWTIPPNQGRKDPTPFQRRACTAPTRWWRTLRFSWTWSLCLSRQVAWKRDSWEPRQLCDFRTCPGTSPRSQSRHQMKLQTLCPSHLWPQYLDWFFGPISVIKDLKHFKKMFCLTTVLLQFSFSYWLGAGYL